jgi:hypothetical protein
MPYASFVRDIALVGSPLGYIAYGILHGKCARSISCRWNSCWTLIGIDAYVDGAIGMAGGLAGGLARSVLGACDIKLSELLDGESLTGLD